MLNKVKKDMHADFHKLLLNLQTERITKGKEDVQNKVALWKLTKTISNFFLANEKFYDALVEADI